MAITERRIEKLEMMMNISDPGPAYISVADEAELEGLQLERPTKVYIGISPDDWEVRNGNI